MLPSDPEAPAVRILYRAWLQLEGGTALIAAGCKKGSPGEHWFQSQLISFWALSTRNSCFFT